MDELLTAVENEKNDRFRKSWTKLDKGSKLNRLTIFIKEEEEKRGLSDDETKSLRKLLFTLCENGLFNRSGDIDYSDESYHIISIKNLKVSMGFSLFALLN